MNGMHLYPLWITFEFQTSIIVPNICLDFCLHIQPRESISQEVHHSLIPQVSYHFIAPLQCPHSIQFRYYQLHCVPSRMILLEYSVQYPFPKKEVLSQELFKFYRITTLQSSSPQLTFLHKC